MLTCRLSSLRCVISYCCSCVGSLISVCHHGRLDYYRGLCFGLIYALSGFTFPSLSCLRRLVLNRMAASHPCQVDLSQNLSLILLGCWGLFLVVSRFFLLPVALLRLLYPNSSENRERYRLHRPGSWFASNRRTIVVLGPFPSILYEASLDSSKMLLIVCSKIFGSPKDGILTRLCREFKGN